MLLNCLYNAFKLAVQRRCTIASKHGIGRPPCVVRHCIRAVRHHLGACLFHRIEGLRSFASGNEHRNRID